MKYVNICGIPHKVIYAKDNFNTDLHLGEIKYDKAEIRINADVDKGLQREAECHEIAHGILVHIGRSDLSNDETFVTALGNALMQSFTPLIREEKTDDN